MTDTNSAHAFNRGYNFGVFVCEFLKICRESFQKTDQTSPHADTKPARAVLHIQPHLSDAQIERLSKLPAMARLNKVDLNSWYEQNLRELPLEERPLKKRRSRSTPKKQAAQTAKVIKFGPLNDLIEPIAPETPASESFRFAGDKSETSQPPCPDLSAFEQEAGVDTSWEN